MIKLPLCEPLYDTTFYETGEVYEILQFNSKGDWHGKQVGFFKCGLKEHESMWKNGKLHGLNRSWHANGQLKFKAYHIEDKTHGWQYRWDSLGNTLDSNYFDMGKLIEEILFRTKSLKLSIHRYYYYTPLKPGNVYFYEDEIASGKRYLVMQDQFDYKGELIGQIRNGNGIEYDIRRGIYYGFKVYKNAYADSTDYISRLGHPKDPRHKRVPIPKSKRIPWDVKKYGSVELPDTAE